MSFTLAPQIRDHDSRWVSLPSVLCFLCDMNELNPTPTLNSPTIQISRAPPTTTAAPINMAFWVALGTPPVATLVLLLLAELSFSRPAVTVTGRL